MNRFKNYIKILAYYSVYILIYLFIVSLLYYFEILNYKIINILSYIFIIFLHVLVGFKVSRFERKKGYLNGFIAGLLLVIIYSIITLIMKGYTAESLIYYLTLILSSMIGGIMGVPNEK